MTELKALLISMSSHMAYMQGQLEAEHQFDDPEDYYWYRESEALRAKAEAALAEPEPEGPRPTDEELCDLWSWSAGQDQGSWPTQQHCFARAVLARWGNHRGILGSSPQPPSDEVEG